MSKKPDAANVQPYGGVDHVRKRPGMYIGGTDQRALHYLVTYIVDHAVEMVLAGHGKCIQITLRENQIVQITDESEGLSLDPHPTTQVTIAQTTMTQFWWGNLLLAPNGLSEWMTLEIRRDGFIWRQHYQRGIPTAPFSIVRTLNADEPTGNTFTFRPDFTILDQNEFDYDTLATRFQELAYSVCGLALILRDERGQPFREDQFRAKAGILEYLHAIRADATPLHDPIFITTEYMLPRDIPVTIELALQLTNRTPLRVEGFVNTLRSSEGTHVTGLMKAVDSFFADKNMPPEVTHGMIAIINIRHPDSRLQSQIHPQLMNQDVEDAMYKLTLKALEQVEWFEI